MEWQLHGKCSGQDTNLFYPMRDSGYMAVTEAAKAICLGSPRTGDPQCPVIKECLLYSLVMPDQHGVWGGMSSRERKLLYKRRSLPDYITREELEQVGVYDEYREEPSTEVSGYEEEAVSGSGDGGADAFDEDPGAEVFTGSPSIGDGEVWVVSERVLVSLEWGDED